MSQIESPSSRITPPSRFALSILALGVVFGDIGTSPLYALRECFFGSHALPITPDSVLGVLSLVLWSLLIIVAGKYVTLVLRVDNRGEGGILALLAVLRSSPLRGRRRRILLSLALFGGALLYGDGIITPAISVLSAVEGVSHVAPHLSGLVLPLTFAILFGLFAVQSRGTAKVGTLFGPVILIWFVTIAILGVLGIAQEPSVMRAIDPRHAAKFLLESGPVGFFVLASVLLVVTGAEALYADVGHFGPSPIRRSWFLVVLPSLALNYFGQGALLLQQPSAVENPFYDLVPHAVLWPVVFIATAATVIASQALISGVFSLTSQAMQLGYCPRLNVLHTSAAVRGQIYVPAVNWLMMVACLLLVAVFRTSSGLAAAYGVAVASTMLITTILAFFVVRSRWGWPLGVAVLLFATLLTIDLAFFSASLVKVRDGGWIPLALAGCVFTVMTTWSRGRSALARVLKDDSVSVERTLENIRRSRVTRVSGSAVFLVRSPEGMPIVLLHHLKHNKVVHERVVLLTVLTEEVPYASDEERIAVQELGDGFWRVVARYGYMENPQVPRILELCRPHGLDLDPMDTTFVLGRETLLTGGSSRMPRWRKRLFSFLSKNAIPATRFFGLPPNRVVELGRQVEL